MVLVANKTDMEERTVKTSRGKQVLSAIYTRFYKPLSTWDILIFGLGQGYM